MVKKKIIIPIFILFFIFSISTIFAADIGSVSGDSVYVEIGSDGGDNYVKPSDCPEGYVMQNITLTGAECIPIFNLTNVTLNTDLNDTQFEYIDDKLNLKLTWLESFISSISKWVDYYTITEIENNYYDKSELLTETEIADEYVPYTGATNDLEMNTNSIETTNLILDEELQDNSSNSVMYWENGYMVVHQR